MRAFFAALESLPFIEQLVELLSPLRIQGDHECSSVVPPFSALHSELLLFHGIFDRFIWDLVELPEDGEWHMGGWKRLSGFRPAFAALFGRRLGWGSGGG